MTNATVTIEKINDIMDNAHGTTQYHYRPYQKMMFYTDSIMALQKECEMFWFVDLVLSHMPTVVNDFKKNEETFYIVEINVDDAHRALFTINKEAYDDDGNYSEKNVCMQDIPYTDLPECSLKFFLELADYDTPTFVLMCPSDH